MGIGKTEASLHAPAPRIQHRGSARQLRRREIVVDLRGEGEEQHGRAPGSCAAKGHIKDYRPWWTATLFGQVTLRSSSFILIALCAGDVNEAEGASADGEGGFGEILLPVTRRPTRRRPVDPRSTVKTAPPSFARPGVPDWR